MKSIARTLFFITIALVGAGLGCSRNSSGQGTGQLTLLDKGLKLYIAKPATWDATKFNTLYKNPKTRSGYTYVTGGVNYGLGPKDSGGDTHIKVHVIAIPKSDVEAYEKGRYPQGAERRLETPEYMIYTAVLDPKDSDVDGVVKSLQIKQ